MGGNGTSARPNPLRTSRASAEIELTKCTLPCGMPTSRYSALSASCGCEPGLIVSTGSPSRSCTVMASSPPAGPTQPISIGRHGMLMMPVSFSTSV